MTQRTKNVTLNGEQAEWVPPTGTDTYADATTRFLQAVGEAEAQVHAIGYVRCSSRIVCFDFVIGQDLSCQ